ncbi:MAG TPA: efflux transporter outer membrane subunit [Alphaproteobacteria bacterium]|nr:efflux transporter outer membrane subunit [Alphaproteobacteria bacterium]
MLGCAGHLPTLKKPDVPGAWQQAAPSGAPIWPTKTWWAGFGSDELNALIATAEGNNFDLAAATARVRQASAVARQAGSVLLPSLAIEGSATHQYGRSSGASAHESDFSAGLAASYELDFWGKNLDTWKSARALRKASIADRQTVALTTTASVADTYFALLSIRERLDIARANLESSRDMVKLIERRVHAGMAAPADLTLQMAAASAEESLIPQLEQQELETRTALATLLGRPPEGFDVKAQDLSGLSSPEVAPGMPSELLTRRPDIVAAEANLEAAHADLAAARAAFLPSIGLTGAGGLQSPSLNGAVTTLAGTGLGYTVSASLLQTLFDGGRKIAVEAEARAHQQELVAKYRSAVIAAYGDVENALGRLAHTAQQQALEERHAALSEKSLTSQQRRYAAGATDFLSVAEAERGLHAARDQLAQARLAHLQAVVSLYRALGGGWSAGNT